MTYQEFLSSKRRRWQGAGFVVEPKALPSPLFDFQRAIVQWALRKGRAAIWADTGLGKTAMQLAWADQVAQRTGGKVLILTPLAVSWQTHAEADKFGIGAQVVKTQADCWTPICITNYEKLQHFDPAAFTGVVLDESSILKSFTGSTKRRLCESFAKTPYRLACTATPAPNDHLEIGNHCEFLGIMASNEMISRWFVNDSMSAGSYRLKGHAAQDFWRWVSSWAVSLRNPEDLGFDGTRFRLPELQIEYVPVHAPGVTLDGSLFADASLSATNLHAVMRQTTPFRARALASLVASEPDESWLTWTHTNYEADAVRAILPDLVEVRGDDQEEEKERALLGFADGLVPHLMTKPSIAGHGMNWQVCARMNFLGLNYSYELFYQAIRRCYRYGQRRSVKVHVFSTDHEFALIDTMQKKQAAHREMQAAMIAAGKEEWDAVVA